MKISDPFCLFGWPPLKAFMTFPENVTSLRRDGKYLIVETAIKRYRVYERPGRKPRRRMIGLLKDLR